MWQVFDCDEPADSSHQKFLKPGYGWDNSIFKTFEEAEKYAKNYLGAYAPVSLRADTPFCYYSDGEKENSLVIKEIVSSNISASKAMVEDIISYFPEGIFLASFDFKWDDEWYKIDSRQNFGKKQDSLNELYGALMALIHDSIAEKHFGENFPCVRIKTGNATVSKGKTVSVFIKEYSMNKEAGAVISVDLG